MGHTDCMSKQFSNLYFRIYPQLKNIKNSEYNALHDKNPLI